MSRFPQLVRGIDFCLRSSFLGPEPDPLNTTAVMVNNSKSGAVSSAGCYPLSGLELLSMRRGAWPLLAGGRRCLDWTVSLDSISFQLLSLRTRKPGLMVGKSLVGSLDLQRGQCARSFE